jgi:uncharacterized protein (UPF0332 family)
MTPIQQLLTLADEELSTAQLLLDNDRFRAAISRAYYSMYHATQALLAAQNLSSKSHKGAISLFGQHFIKNGRLPKSMARDLSDAYDLRRLSDYEETALLTREQAATILTSAHHFIEQTRQHLP